MGRLLVRVDVSVDVSVMRRRAGAKESWALLTLALASSAGQILQQMGMRAGA